MLRFAQKTDGAFAAIVENSLELALDMMGDESNAREYGIYNDTAQWFGGERLIRAADKLLEAHRGEKVYAPNDYHFFLLHKVISFYVDSHNDAIATEGKPQDVRSFLIGKIDYEAIQNIFFWDADYEISPEKYSSLTREEKERFRKGRFSDKSPPP